MTINEIKDYIEAKPALTKIEITTEQCEDATYFMVTKTKETYVFDNEEDADNLINKLRQYPNFIGVEKKYKKGKMNKAGEIVKPETWNVIAKLNHN